MNRTRHPQTDIAKYQPCPEGLRPIEPLLQATLDSLPCNLAILDETGTILAVNGAWRQFAEANGLRSPFHGLGANYLQVCDKAVNANSEEAAEAAQGMRKIIARQREHFALEYPCHSPEVQRWFALRLTCVDDGERLRVIVVHDDITVCKQAEMLRRQLQSQLQASQNMEVAGRGIAHDLSNMLGSIFLYTEVAQSYARHSSELQYNLQNVLTAARRGKDLTHQILAFNRQAETVWQDVTQRLTPNGTGRILFVDDEPSLARPIQTLLERFGYQVVSVVSSLEAFKIFSRNPHGFDLLLTDQTMPYMTGDQLTRAVRRVRPDLPVILCTGMSHVLNADKARAMGFDDFCTKPLLAEELASKIQQVLTKHAQSAAPAGLRILLIDDDDQYRLGLSQILASEGYEIVEARNGREGLQHYREAPTDLIITDLLMPDQDGVETISELKRDFPNAKIIAISGGGQTGQHNYLYIAKRLGAQKTLSKPFDLDELLRVIRELL